MKSLIVVIFVCLAVASAKPSGWGAWGGHGVTIIGPSAGHAVVAGPAQGWAGHGGWGWGGWGDWAGPGVVIKGPVTVPAVVAGPSGKIVADGLYGVPHHW